MTIEKFLEFIRSGQEITVDSDIHKFMGIMSSEDMKITCCLNNSYHTPEEIRQLFSKLIGKDVDETFSLFPPFTTDFGKNIIVGKNVFINSGCRFQDHGGITIDDGAQIGHNVVIATLNDNLLATTQAIYKSWFVDFEPFDNVCPSDWGNGCVDDIAEFYDSMRKPLSSLERADMERIYPYYGAVSIVDYVDDFIFDGEYLLLSEDGIYVVDENGHPLLQHITGKFWANNHAHILKGKSGFNEDSLYLFLANTNMAPIVTGAAQPKINQANLKSFPITIPTSEVIENFNALIQPFFDQRLSNEAEVKKLESLKDLLLSRLVN